MPVRVLGDLPITFEIGDPLVYVDVSLLLSLAALAAMCGPAWRAARDRAYASVAAGLSNKANG